MKVPHYLLRTLLPVALLSVAAAVPSQAQTTMQALTNGDFEMQNPQLAAGGKVNGFATLTGFQNMSSTAPSNSGVQYGTANPNNTGGAGSVAESGNFFIYEKGGDPGTFQITSSVLAANEKVTLTWYAANSYQSPIQEVGILTGTSTSSTFANATQVAVANGSTNTTYAIPAYTGANPGPYNMYTLTYNTTAADVGNDVGIFIEDIATTAANSFVNFDNFTLGITAIPEPATYAQGMAIVGMAAWVIAARRRKQTISKSLYV